MAVSVLQFCICVDVFYPGAMAFEIVREAVTGDTVPRYAAIVTAVVAESFVTGNLHTLLVVEQRVGYIILRVARKEQMFITGLLR